MAPKAPNKKPHYSKAQIPPLSFPIFTPPRVSTPYPHLPILLLSFQTQEQQSLSLRRIAAFYESSDTDIKGVYLPLSDPRCESLCRHYLGFNFPISAIEEWLASLISSISVEKQDPRKWRDELHDGEKWLVETLQQRKWIDIEEIMSLAQGSVEIRSTLEPSKDLYLISHLSGQTQAVTHELQHAFYHLSPSLRTLTDQLFTQHLSPKQQQIVIADLARRGYSEDAYMDEY